MFKKAIRECHDKSLRKGLAKLIKSNGNNIILTKSELSMIYHLDRMQLLSLMDHEVRIERPKMSVFKLIISYSDIEDKTVNIMLDERVNYDDIVDIMLEEDASDEEVLHMIRAFTHEWNLETILSLVIMKQRYFLTQKIIDEYD